MKIAKIGKILRDRKAVSPVISVLLMVSIAVVAALITYTWVTGFVGTTTTKAGNALQIQSVKFNSSVPGVTGTNGTLTIYVQNVGQGPLKIVGIYVNNTLASDSTHFTTSDLNGDGSTDDAFATLGSAILPKGATAIINLKSMDDIITDWSTGQDVKIRIVCEDGTFTEGTFLIP